MTKNFYKRIINILSLDEWLLKLSKQMKVKFIAYYRSKKLLYELDNVKRKKSLFIQTTEGEN